MTLPDAARSGDRLATLCELRDVLADSIVQADPEKRSSLTAQLVVVLAQIDALKPQEKAGDPLDEIAARRSARGGATARSRRTATD